MRQRRHLRDESDDASSHESPSKKSRLEAPADSVDSAPLRVLTDGDLFRSVVAFLPGLPHGIVRFEREFMASARDRLRIATRVEEVMGDADVPPSSDDAELLLVAPQHGMLRLWHDEELPLEAHDGWLGDDEDDPQDDPLDDTDSSRLRDALQVQPRVARWVRDFDDVDDERHNTAKLVALLRRDEASRRTHMQAAIVENQPRVLELIYRRHHQPRDEMYPSMPFRAPMLVAARHARLEMLEWLALKPECDAWLDDDHLLDAALRSGDLKTIEWVYNAQSALIRERRARIRCVTVNRAAALGALHVLQWIDAHEELTYDLTEVAVDAAACNGHLEVVKYLTERHAKLSGTTVAMDLAARNGHFEVVQYLDVHRQEGCTHRAMDLAAKGGHLPIVQYLHERRQEGCSTQAMELAARAGHMDVVKFLHEHRTEGCSTNALDFAAARGHLEIVQFLHEHRSEGASTNAMDGAALEGHLDVVRFLHEKPQEGCTVLAMNGAAARGHLEVVRFLHANRSEGCTTLAMDSAAANGHLEVVRFLHEHRTEGATTDAMDHAAARGRLDVIKFLHEHREEGCTNDAMDSAATQNRLDVLEFLQANRSEGCSKRALVGAAGRNHMRIVTFLLQHHTFHRNARAIVNEAACNGHLEMVQFLIRKGFKWNFHAIDGAATGGYCAVVKFLLDVNPDENDPSSTTEDGGESPLDDYEEDQCHTEAALDGAMGNGHWDVMRLLMLTCSEWTSFGLEMAVGNGYLDIVDHVLMHRRVGEPSVPFRGYLLAAGLGDIEMVQLLRAYYGVGIAEEDDGDEEEDEGDEEEDDDNDHDPFFFPRERDNSNNDNDNDENSDENTAAGANAPGEDGDNPGRNDEFARLWNLMMGFNEPQDDDDNAPVGPAGQLLQLINNTLRAQGRLHEPLPVNRVSFEPMEMPASIVQQQMVQAARRGHLQLLCFLLEQYPTVELIPDIVAAAASSGHLDIVKYLTQEHDAPCASAAMNGAAKRGHLAVVQYLHANRTEGCTTDAMDGAAKNGFLSVVRFLHQHRQEGCTHLAMERAAGGGHLTIVRFLHENREEGCGVFAMDLAVERGSIDVVRFLHKNRSEGCSSSALVLAHGFKYLVQYLCENFSSSTLRPSLDAAASAGAVDTLQYLQLKFGRTALCSTGAFRLAIERGYLDVVKWLHLHRPETLTPAAIDVAAGHGQLTIARFLHEHRSEGCTNFAMEMAIEANDLCMVQFLHKHLKRSFDPWQVETLDPALTVTKYIRAQLPPHTATANSVE
ncbi:hypothetical protein PINS_up013910 [Pythium insidiosum]|nr:hypothetical protein PINS_up013910 [Pythium insidiosum]